MKFTKNPTLYNALNIKTTEDNVCSQQYRFLIRVQRNEYLKNFLDENRRMVNNECLICSIVKGLNLKVDSTVELINIAISTELVRFNREISDRFYIHEDAQEVKVILTFNNSKFRSFKLMRKLYYKIRFDYKILFYLIKFCLFLYFILFILSVMLFLVALLT